MRALAPPILGQDRGTAGAGLAQLQGLSHIPLAQRGKGKSQGHHLGLRTWQEVTSLTGGLPSFS